jgi:hypothetical protein
MSSSNLFEYGWEFLSLTKAIAKNKKIKEVEKN